MANPRRDLVRVTHGVHRPPAQLPDAEATIAALISACAPDSVVAGWTAAQLYGLWLPDRPDRPQPRRTRRRSPEAVEVILRGSVVAPVAISGSRRFELRGRRRRLHPQDIEHRDGLPIVSAARCWLDLADRLSVPDLVAVGDCVLGRGTELEQLVSVVDRSAGVPGIRSCRQALELLDGRSRSRPESLMRVALVLAGLPKPEVNRAVVTEDGEWLFEPDLSYPDLRLAIEYNGADHAEVDRMRRDITRQLDGYHRGRWEMLVFGAAEVFRRPDQLAAIVARKRSDLASARARRP